MKARKATLLGAMAAGMLAAQGAFADAEPSLAPASAPPSLTVEDQLTATFGPVADGGLVPLTERQMKATEGQLWPLIGAVVTLDLALSSYFWGVYVPTVYGSSSGFCVSCYAP